VRRITEAKAKAAEKAEVATPRYSRPARCPPTWPPWTTIMATHALVRSMGIHHREFAWRSCWPCLHDRIIYVFYIMIWPAKVQPCRGQVVVPPSTER
jgi:hypothetical protein